jgi:hypothetical protein
MYDLMVLSIFTDICNYHQSILGHFHFLKKKPLSLQPSFPPSTPYSEGLATIIVSTESPILDLQEWNQIVCGLLWPSSFT